jgi:hypothetical protein
MNMNVGFTRTSKNAKTGPIPTSITSAKSCPTACPLSQGGCYAKNHYLGKHWSLVTEGVRGMSWTLFLANIIDLPKGQLWRHNVAGDLPGEGDTIDLIALDSLVQANKGKRGFTYTHKPATDANLDAVEKANREGFTINLSANSLAHADELKAKSIAPVAVILTENHEEKSFMTPAGNKVTVCPATYRDETNCATCKLCSIPNRQTIIGFPAHGATRKKASNIAEGQEEEKAA